MEAHILPSLKNIPRVKVFLFDDLLWLLRKGGQVAACSCAVHIKK